MRNQKRNVKERVVLVFILAAVLCLPAATTARAQDVVKETLELKDLTPLKLKEFLSLWQGGITEVQIDEAQNTVSVMGRKEKAKPRHTIFCVTPAGVEQADYRGDSADGARAWADSLFEELKAKARARETSEIFNIEHMDVGRLTKLLGVFVGDNGAFNMAADPDSGTLVVRGAPEVVAMVRTAVERLDAPEPPKKNIEFTGYILQGISGGENEPGTVPEALGDVVTALQQTFLYTHYRLIDTVILRCRDAERGRTRGSLAGLPESHTGNYELDVESARIEAAGGETASIRIEQLSFEGAVEYPLEEPALEQARPTVPSYRSSGFSIRAGVDFEEGQKVVVGKAGAEGYGGAIFLVLTARVVD